MIIDFAVKNYLSFRDQATFSLLASKKSAKNGALQPMALLPVESGRFQVYPFSVLYGANASGKTNLLKALIDFRDLVLNSHKLELDQEIPFYKPFRLDIASASAPVSFEIEFYSRATRYTYGIEYNAQEVLFEELNFYPEGRKARLFLRIKGQPLKFGTKFSGEKKSIENFLLPNRLFLSLAANSNLEILHPVYRYFRDKINFHIRMDSSGLPLVGTTLLLKQGGAELKTKILKMLNAADLAIRDIDLVEDEKIAERIKIEPAVSPEIRQKIISDFKLRPHTGYQIFNDGHPTEETAWFDLNKEDSSGTIKMYEIAGLVLDALKNGRVLVIDELNSGLHPHLSSFIINMFINPEININQAQLIVTTHDVSLLDEKSLQREQIWFSQKDQYGGSELFSLAEFDKNLVRENSKYAKNYLDGRFQAVPATALAKLKPEVPATQ